VVSVSLVKELLSDITVSPDQNGCIWRYTVKGVIQHDRRYPTRRAAARAIKRREEKRLRASLRAR